MFFVDQIYVRSCKRLVVAALAADVIEGILQQEAPVTDHINWLLNNIAVVQVKIVVLK